MKSHADVIVVGAGPAGCSSAIYLAQRGQNVILLDKAHFPRPKACGEGIMPTGIPILEELGVLPDVEKKGRRFYGIQFSGQDGHRATGYFPYSRYGITLPREVLDPLLLERARSFSSVQVLESHKVIAPVIENDRVKGVAVEASGGHRQTYFATHHILADGASSTVAQAMGITRDIPRRRRYGMRAHFSGVEGLQELVEVFFLEGGEIYLAAQAGEKNALVAIVLEENWMARFAGRTQGGFFDMIQLCRPLAERMTSAVQYTKIIGLGPLGGSMQRWNGPGWWLVGDAASSVDPITGEGISLALSNGKLVAQEILGVPNASGGSYVRRRKRLLLKKNLLAKLLLSVSNHRRAANFVIQLLAHRPALFRWFLKSC